MGFRMILAHPDRTEAVIVQDAVAHNEGLGANWKTRRAFWADRAGQRECVAHQSAVARDRRVRGTSEMIPNVERHDPDFWTDESFLNRPGEADIQSDLFYDYRTSGDAYPKWQAWMKRPNRDCSCSGANTILSFDLSEPEPTARTFRRLRFTFLTQGTSPLIPPRMRLLS